LIGRQAGPRISCPLSPLSLGSFISWINFPVSHVCLEQIQTKIMLANYSVHRVGGRGESKEKDLPGRGLGRIERRGLCVGRSAGRGVPLHCRRKTGPENWHRGGKTATEHIDEWEGEVVFPRPQGKYGGILRILRRNTVIRWRDHLCPWGCNTVGGGDAEGGESKSGCRPGQNIKNLCLVRLER